MHPLTISFRFLFFQLQQGFFALNSPAITAHASVFPNNPMARNRDGDRIRGTRASHGPGRGGLSDRFGDLAVGLCGPKRQRLQMRPHPPLKGCRLNVQRQESGLAGARYVVKQRLGPGPHGLVVPLTDGEGEFALQPFDQFVVGVSELNRADSLFGGGNQHAAQGRIVQACSGS